MAAAVVLDEAVDLLVEAVPADVVVDRGAHRSPAIDGSVQAESFDADDRAIQRDPAHHAGMRVGAGRSTDFPDAMIERLPMFLQMLNQDLLQLPGVRARLQSRLASGMKRVQKFSENVELRLGGGAVADSHRPAAGIAIEPRYLVFGQPALAGHAVQDLELPRLAGHRTQYPLPPRFRFLTVAGVEQGIERERRVPDPAIAIVPVPRTADPFRQRRRRRRDDAAARREGQELERHQRTHHRLPPRLGHVLEAGAAHPFAPPRTGLLEGDTGVRHEVRSFERRMIRQRDRHALALRYGEVRHRLHVLATQRQSGRQFDGVGTGDGADPVVATLHPRHGPAVAEP